MNEKYFQSLLSYVIEDAAFRNSSKPRESLPPSWTAARLREIERDSGQTTTVLSAELLNVDDNRVWRRYAPAIDTVRETLTPAEERLKTIVARHLSAESFQNDANALKAELDRITPIINLHQAIHARGALSITPNRFFSAVRISSERGYISDTTSDTVTYSSLMILTMRTAILRWLRTKNITTQDALINRPIAGMTEAIQETINFQKNLLAGVSDSRYSHFILDLPSVASQYNNPCYIVATEHSLKLPRDTINNISQPELRIIPFSTPQINFLGRLLNGE